MTIKGLIKENHIPLNKFDLLVLGMPKITLISFDDIEEELEAVTLPDRTVRSGGQTKPVNFSGKLPMHHDVEIAAMELWYKQGQDPVQPGYKKAATMIFYRGDGGVRTFSLLNLWISGRTIPGGDMKNEGEMAELTYKFQADEVTPV
jgi:hypothetical protein